MEINFPKSSAKGKYTKFRKRTIIPISKTKVATGITTKLANKNNVGTCLKYNNIKGKTPS